MDSCIDIFIPNTSIMPPKSKIYFRGFKFFVLDGATHIKILQNLFIYYFFKNKK
jgi:hypothetical protein